MLSLNNSENRSVREINRSRVLQAIKINGLISRIDLAEKTGLNPSTISRSVDELQELRLVSERRVGKSSGGRKPVLLGLDRTYHRFIGVDIGATKIITVVINLLGEVLDRVTVEIDYSAGEVVDISPEIVIDSIRKLLERHREDFSFSDKNIPGIGVGAHGLVDKERGLSLFAPNFGWENVPLGKMLAQEFSLFTVVDNDVRVMALGEYWFGHGQDAKNLLCVNAGYGIGSGIIFEGEVYRGHNSMAGEIGHTTVLEDGPRCNCGDYGCLEAVASGPAIARQMRKKLKKGYESIISGMVDGNLDRITGKIVGQAANRGDDLARNILRQAGNYLGIGIANTVNVLDPELVLIGGGVAEAGEIITDSLEEAVSKKSMVATPTIAPVKLGRQTGAIGAGVLVMEELYRSPSEFLHKKSSLGGD